MADILDISYKNGWHVVAFFIFAEIKHVVEVKTHIAGVKAYSYKTQYDMKANDLIASVFSKVICYQMNNESVSCQQIDMLNPVTTKFLMGELVYWIPDRVWDKSMVLPFRDGKVFD